MQASSSTPTPASASLTLAASICEGSRSQPDASAKRPAADAAEPGASPLQQEAPPLQQAEGPPLQQVKRLRRDVAPERGATSAVELTEYAHDVSPATGREAVKSIAQLQSHLRQLSEYLAGVTVNTVFVKGSAAAEQDPDSQRGELLAAQLRKFAERLEQHPSVQAHILRSWQPARINAAVEAAAKSAERPAAAAAAGVSDEVAGEAEVSDDEEEEEEEYLGGTSSGDDGDAETQAGTVPAHMQHDPPFWLLSIRWGGEVVLSVDCVASC